MNRQAIPSKTLTCWVSCLLLTSVFLSGCKQEAPEQVERIRAVKTIVVADLASDQMRKFPGTIEPVDSSLLSFEVEGIVQEVLVDVGDKFKKGDVLVRLDNKPFQLSVESARAALSRTSAQLQEKQSAYEREVRIQKEDAGATTQKAVDQARAAYESQVQGVTYNEAQLELAQRDLSHTELIAPYDGTVSARSVEPAEVAARGVHMLEVYADAAMQVAVSVPEQMIENVYAGLEGKVLINNRPDYPYDAIVAEVGSSATSANAYPVTAIISNADERVRPGMTAELRLTFVDAEIQAAFLVPVHAFIPGTVKGENHVYLFDPQTSVVKKSPVKTKGIQGNYVVVTEGIAPGDILVVAGVSFLRDGQQVKPMTDSDSNP